MITQALRPILPTTEIHNRTNSLAYNTKIQHEIDPTFGSLTNRTNREILTFRDDILKNIDQALLFDDDFFSGSLAMQTLDSGLKLKKKKTRIHKEKKRNASGLRTLKEKVLFL